ncbi:SGT1-domain-containing protein [Thelephora ganbajun]|uniref:SGT1-domain-containing protein n=1 Tax=Thelephora ganbajun TaxID=370292 RepID=A0ACB6ZFE1_THEGA|nr:SGT1-domain-containing protein [Thelephora ganbajun]
MDIFNRPPAISEDAVQYRLYPSQQSANKVSVLALATVLKDYTDDLLPGFLWHRDPFELKVVSDANGWVLEGTMRVGDCVDDEWCVVWLLREISKKWDLAISVSDSDGEFLLIEAAEVLPSWVTPSNAENRIWIYNSQLHLVPLSHISPPSPKPARRQRPGRGQSDDEDNDLVEEDDNYISVKDALKVVRDNPVQTRAPSKVENVVWDRISRYPAAGKQHTHVTRVWLPTDIAKILSVDQTLVQKPVETFYTRDAIQLRAAHRMSKFPPQPVVLTAVRMTRVAYAQLVGQKFHPPKIWGYWNEPEGTKEWRWRDIGMKLACGFEMLYQESKNRLDAASIPSEATDEARKDALRRDTEYTGYIERLKSVGYFGSELPESNVWKTLENKAATAYINSRKEDDVTRPSFASKINAALKAAGHIDLSRCPEEEPDNWLDIDAENFDTMLQNMAPGQPEDIGAMNVEQKEEQLAQNQASKLKSLAQKVEKFVEGEGDLEGARFEDDDTSDEFSEGMPDSDDESNPETQTDDDVAKNRLVPGLEPGEYGKMPPLFYANSQKVAPEPELEEEEPSKSAVGEDKETPSVRRPIRPPILPRDKFDGVDSDDETDEDELVVGNEDSDEDHPELVGEIEPDMNEEEEEFLEFSRRALGISNEQWNDIINERKNRGAFVPLAAIPLGSKVQEKPASDPSQTNGGPSIWSKATNDSGTGKNPTLDSFESVMQAMDIELARPRPSDGKRKPPAASKDKGKGKAAESAIPADGDIDAAMDAELRTLLEREGLSDDSGDDGEGIDPGIDYNLIKNFLESFKSQAGLSGPVSNLAGRLQPDFNLPRDFGWDLAGNK